MPRGRLARSVAARSVPRSRWGPRVRAAERADVSAQLLRDYAFADFAAALAACFVARTLASDSGSTMSATDANEPASP